MKKLFLLLLLAGCLQGAPAQTMATLFTQMPDSVLPLLNSGARDALVHGYGRVDDLQVVDELGGRVQLDSLADHYLRLTTSGSSRLDMQMFFTPGEQDDTLALLAMVETVSAPASDSRVRFFDSQWRLQQWIELPEPEVADYFPSVPDSVAEDIGQVVRELSELPLVAVEMSPSAPVFTLTIALDHLDLEQKKLATQWQRPLRYRWDGNEFQRIEE